MKVIIFGGTGWVGHHTAIYFNKAGYDVTVCSRGQKNDFMDQFPEQIKIRKADKQNEMDMARIFADSYDVIIDSVPTESSIKNIVKLADQPKHYLHCSSVVSYAPLKFVPGDETMPYDDFMGLGENKNIVDSMVMDLHDRGKLASTVIRPSYITGPGRYPIDNLGGRRTDFISDILAENQLDLPSDGKALLHPVHVKDVAKSFLLAVQSPVSIGRIYNICGEKAVTIADYLELNAAALDRKININLMSIDDMILKYKDAISEYWFRFFAEHMCYDIGKAIRDLDYKPRCTTAQAIAENAHYVTEHM